MILNNKTQNSEKKPDFESANNRPIILLINYIIYLFIIFLKDLNLNKPRG